MPSEIEREFSRENSTYVTHIHNLIEKVARSPFEVAPEQSDKLSEIRDRHRVNFQIDDTGNTEFRFNAIFGRIYTSIRSLQHIWAAACYYESLCGERQRSIELSLTEIPITRNVDIEVVTILYEMSCNAFLHSKPMLWPPDISLVTPNTEYIKRADELFLLICSFSILHEIGHFECGHNKVSEGGVKEEITDEYVTELVADKWAYDWILLEWKKFSEDPRIFTKRIRGIIFALSMTEEFYYLSKQNAHQTHPRAVDRLLQLYDNYSGQIEERDRSTTCFIAASIGLQMIAVNNRNPLPKGPYNGIRDFLFKMKTTNELNPQKL